MVLYHGEEITESNVPYWSPYSNLLYKNHQDWDLLTKTNGLNISQNIKCYVWDVLEWSRENSEKWHRTGPSVLNQKHSTYVRRQSRLFFTKFWKWIFTRQEAIRPSFLMYFFFSISKSWLLESWRNWLEMKIFF